MENRDRFKLVIGIASLAFASFFLRTRFKKKRTNKRPSNSCSLHLDQKPQSAFKRVLADNSYSPFKHLQLASQSYEESPLHSHPYESEITSLLENPQLKFDVFSKHVNLEPITSHIWVDKEEQLQELFETLSKEKAFGVDTEQHSLRSFLGFTALIQISTSEEDYLVDTIALHDVMGILRPVFSNPDICKVFHGADNDVLWLQRDFHIYVVNLFDTAKACEVLSKPQKSLAYLLETCCGVSTNKLFQREDWRQRPLSEEMLEYAQTDAHFLLYIANCLISELRQWSGRDSSCPDDEFQSLLEASRRSNTVCLQLYSKEEEEFPGAYSASSILSKHFGSQLGSSSDSSETQDMIGQLCAWRDLMARIHDESLRYVLSDQGIVAVAEKHPHNEAEICNVISLTDQNMDSNFFIQSPSAVINSHARDLLCLLNQLMRPDEVFQNILQKCLGPNGTCPLSGFNYALLSKSNLKLVSGSVPKQNPAINSKKLRRKCSRQLFIQKFSCKSPVYHNCRIYDHDGRLLCYCDRRKLEWYLRRDLAKLVEENPPAIMLLFEPKGRPEDEGNDFYIQTKKNICVGCGEKKHYLRYRIIPSCYRIHFPEHLKSHRSHDIVLLCVNCHEVAHAAAEKYKKQIAAELGIPLFVQKVVNMSQSRVPNDSGMVNHDDGVSPLQLRSAAMALLRHGPSMPAKRREELYQTVKKYYGGREISEDDLERAMLVGMTPHERRRIEKKKGISLRHSQGYALSNKVLEDNGSGSMPVVEDTSEGGAIYNSNSGVEAYPEEKEQDLSITEDSVDISEMTIVLSCEHELEDQDSVDISDTTIVISCEHELEDPSIKEKTDAETLSLSELNEEAIVACSERRQGLETKDTSDAQTSFDETLEFSYSTSNGTGSPKHHSKLSLLGHGPHGKQVVDHLLNEHGEDGILLFCQKWRQVFVSAVHPRFLAPGWDVMHSGRRDFGEFSVYNPAKSTSSAAKS